MGSVMYRGDIVVYSSEWFSRGPIIHRVINITEVNGSKLFTDKRRS
ncbi:MAG: hypothetical protein LBV42_06050 [Methanobrevibacter sp.]|nr:hypothetical protein [Methanobrevibacter sp.]